MSGSRRDCKTFGKTKGKTKLLTLNLKNKKETKKINIISVKKLKTFSLNLETLKQQNQSQKWQHTL
jgi:hypothetical protein